MSKKLRGVVKARRIAAVGLAILSAWVISSPRFFPGLYTSKLFHPDKDLGSAQQVAALKAYREVPNQEVFFTAQNGNRLHGWLFLQPGATKIYVLFPGNAGDIPRRLDYFKVLLASGASVFTYEPRGFGKSEGTPTIASICQDGESAYDYVSKTLGYKSEQIVLFGVSLGTTVATHVSTVRSACGLILQSGFSSLEDIAYEKVPFLRIYPAFLFPQSPALNNVDIVGISSTHVPLLVMHGGDGHDHQYQARSRKIFRLASRSKTFARLPTFQSRKYRRKGPAFVCYHAQAISWHAQMKTHRKAAGIEIATVSAPGIKEKRPRLLWLRAAIVLAFLFCSSHTSGYSILISGLNSQFGPCPSAEFFIFAPSSGRAAAGQYSRTFHDGICLAVSRLVRLRIDPVRFLNPTHASPIINGDCHKFVIASSQLRNTVALDY